MIVAAVPSRDFVTAKQRLVQSLDGRQRAALARAMLGDVLAAVTAAPIETVYVVTADPEVSAYARAFRTVVLLEDLARGHTEAVARAQAAAEAAGADVFITVPGDVPCVSTDEVAALIDAARGPRSAVFVPSVSGYGTNAVALRPPGAMPLKFGEPSFDNHLAAARALDVAPVVLALAGLGLDIDTPDDLRALLDRRTGTRSGHLLDAWAKTGRVGPARSRGASEASS